MFELAFQTFKYNTYVYHIFVCLIDAHTPEAMKRMKQAGLLTRDRPNQSSFPYDESYSGLYFFS